MLVARTGSWPMSQGLARARVEELGIEGSNHESRARVSLYAMAVLAELAQATKYTVVVEANAHITSQTKLGLGSPSSLGP